MLLRPGSIPTGTEWAFEVKWDGFRAVVSTEDGLRVRSRRAGTCRRARGSPAWAVLDGELVALNDEGALHWPARL